MEKEWGIGGYDESLLGSLVFTGYLIGSLFSGKLSDKYGRRWPLFFSSVLIFVFALASAASFSFWFFVLLRVLFGVVVGFSVPISFTVLAENTPVKQRGAMLALIGVFYTMGELWVCLVALLTMSDLKTGNEALPFGAGSRLLGTIK